MFYLKKEIVNILLTPLIVSDLIAALVKIIKIAEFLEEKEPAIGQKVIL